MFISMKTTDLRAARIGSSGVCFFVCLVYVFFVCFLYVWCMHSPRRKTVYLPILFFRNLVLEIILSPLQGMPMYYPSGVVYNLGLLTHFAPYGIFVLKTKTRKIVKVYKFSSLILRVKMSWYLQYILFTKRTEAFWPRVVICLIGILGHFEL